jgi:hypothetical protein
VDDDNTIEHLFSVKKSNRDVITRNKLKEIREHVSIVLEIGASLKRKQAGGGKCAQTYAIGM